MVLAVTDLSSYDYCKRKLFLEKVLKIRAPFPKDVMIKGTIAHSAFETCVLEEKNIVSQISYATDISMHYKEKCSSILTSVVSKNKKRLSEIGINTSEAFSLFWPPLQTFVESRGDVVSSLRESSGKIGADLWTVLTPKLKAEYRMQSESVGVRGIIDQLEVYSSELVPVELKTGKAPTEGAWPGHRMQVGAYLLLLQEQFQKVNRGYVHYVESNKKVEIVLNPFLRDDVHKRVSEVNNLLGGKTVPDRLSNVKKCAACALKDQCFDDSLVGRRAAEKGFSY